LTGPLLTARQVADQLGLSTETVLNWVRRGELPAFRLGRAIRFREADVDTWLQERATPKRGVSTATPGAAPLRTLPSPASTATPREES
jgi:excisionase family DNA binding protein